MLDANQIAETVRAQDADPEVSASTLHYYVQVGILPPAVGRGRNSYTPEHLNRFRLARYLRREGLGLPQIREQLKDLSSTAVTAELLQRASPGARPPRRSAPVSRRP
jgi:DNA-binding transcriptional MerR regulator